MSMRLVFKYWYQVHVLINNIVAVQDELVKSISTCRLCNVYFNTCFFCAEWSCSLYDDFSYPMI